jgi:putative membrane protein
MRVTLLLGGFLACASAQAHEAAGLGTETIWGAWNERVWLWLLFFGSAALVLRGTVTLWRHAQPGAGIRHWQTGSFFAGWLVLGLSILTPLDAMGEQLFWAHMVQHELMMLVAAPLLVLGRPLGAMVWGLPPRWRAPAASLVAAVGLKGAVRWLTRPLTAWMLHAAALWAWHAPPLFEAAVNVPWVHDLQHVSFFLSALLFWWSLLQRRCEHYGGAVLYIFTTAVHTSALGALLTFSPRALYSAYEESAPVWGLSPLEDQQLAGLIMWVPGGLVFLVAALALFAAWMLGSDGAQRTVKVEARG